MKWMGCNPICAMKNIMWTDLLQWKCHWCDTHRNLFGLFLKLKWHARISVLHIRRLSILQLNQHFIRYNFRNIFLAIITNIIVSSNIWFQVWLTVVWAFATIAYTYQITYLPHVHFSLSWRDFPLDYWLTPQSISVIEHQTNHSKLKGR